MADDDLEIFGRIRVTDDGTVVIEKFNQETRKTKEETDKAAQGLRNLGRELDDWISELKAATPQNIEFARRIREITKAYQDGKVPADQARQSLDKIRSEMKAGDPPTRKMGLNFTELNSAVQLVRTGLEAAKGAFDFAKEGASIDYARGKFDRLSASIGTTSTALLVDLKTATRGMVTDAALVASAGDLMALGLAKSHDEAVRLTKVAGGLGMDMNQLVLTLTNETTMRFDALGVSVDGFDAKVDKLKATGMSTSAAFKEAFLQQAEDQLKKVGEQADSNVATFIRFENSITNVTNALKGLAANDLTIAGLEQMTARIAGMQYAFEAFKQGKLSLLEFQTATRTLMTGQGDVIATSKLLGEILAGTAKTTEEVADETSHAAYTQRNWNTEIGESKNAIAEWIAAEKTADYQRRSAGINLGELDQQSREYAESLDITARAEQTAANAAAVADQQRLARLEVLDQLKAAEQNYQAAIQNFNDNIAGQLVSGFEKMNLSLKDQRAAYVAMDEVLNTNYTAQFDQKNALDELLKSYDPKKPEEFKKALAGFKEAWAPMNEGILEAKGKLEDLQAQYEAMKNQRVDMFIDVWYQYHGNPPGGGGGYSGKGSGAENQGDTPGYATGGQFTVKGQPGRAVPIDFLAHAGEVVTISNPMLNQQPPGSGGGGGSTVNNYYNSSMSMQVQAAHSEEDLTDQFGMMRARAGV